MKKLFLIISILVCSIASYSQDVIGSRVIAKNSLFVRDRWVDTITVDTSKFLNYNRSIPTAGAVYEFVNARMSGGAITQGVNGLHKSNDSLKLGGNLIDSFTLIKTNTRRNNLWGAKLALSNVSSDSSLIMRAAETKSSLMTIERWLYQDYGDTSWGINTNKYSAPLAISGRYYFDSASEHYTNSNPIQLLNGGMSAASRLYPPANASSIFVGQFGNTGSASVAENSIGERWGYNVNLVNSSSAGNSPFPYSATYSIWDLERELTTNKRRTITGTGITNYLSNWKSYQHDITSGTNEDSSYINKIYDYYSIGSLLEYPNSPSKAKTLAVSKVDSAIGFYSAPKRKLLNEVQNGFGFVQDGIYDYNFFAGRTRFSGLQPTQNNGGMNGIVEINQDTTGIGTISVSAAGTTVTGTGTSFLYDFNVGDSIIANGEIRRISNISSATSMTTTAWTNTFAGVYKLRGGNRQLFSGKGTLFFGNPAPANSNGSINITRTFLNPAIGIHNIRNAFTISNTTGSSISSGSIGYFGSTFIGSNNTSNYTSASTASTFKFTVNSGATGSITGSNGFAVGVSSTIENLASGFSVGGAINYRAFFDASSGIISKGLSYLSAGLGVPANSTGLLLQTGSNFDTTLIPAGHYAIYDNTGYSSYFKGNIGIAQVTTTARLHLPAGTATASTAPLKFTSGTNLTTPEAGAVEFDGTNFYQTNSTAARGVFEKTRTIVSSAGTLSIDGTYSDWIFSGTTTTWTLPALTGSTNIKIYIKNRGSGNITLNSNAGGNDIYNTSAVNTFTIAAGAAYIVVSDGTFWNIE